MSQAQNSNLLKKKNKNFNDFKEFKDIKDIIPNTNKLLKIL